MGINALQQRYFLDKNGVLFMDGKKMIDDHTLVALTIMIAETRSEEMEMMVTVILIIWSKCIMELPCIMVLTIHFIREFLI